MGDFYQHGIISTLHMIGKNHIDIMESRIKEASAKRTVSLILPIAGSDLNNQALSGIIHELEKVDYLRRIIIGLDNANEDEYKRTKEIFSTLPQEVTIIWNNNPGMETIYSRLWAESLVDVSSGKGRSVWICIGYLLACKDTDIIAIHNCDITTYERSLLARLVYPLMDDRMEYGFAKGYYARASSMLYGRLTRLFVTPLIHALSSILDPAPYIKYLNTFRYPLSGECAMEATLAKAMRMPSNLSFEVGLLSEVYDNCALKRVCQIDLGIDYDHKHQELSIDDPSQGLLKMSIDIGISLFHTLAGQGIVLSEDTFRAIKASFNRYGKDTMNFYADDAILNNLRLDRHSETKALKTFGKGLDIASVEFLKNPIDTTFISSWTQVNSAIPDIYNELLATVDSDNS